MNKRTLMKFIQHILDNNSVYKASFTLKELIKILEQQRKKVLGNKTLLMVFTDKYALKLYDSETKMTVTDVTLDELYRLAEDNESISGIVVNPGREDFKMKKM